MENKDHKIKSHIKDKEGNIYFYIRVWQSYETKEWIVDDCRHWINYSKGMHMINWWKKTVGKKRAACFLVKHYEIDDNKPDIVTIFKDPHEKRKFILSKDSLRQDFVLKLLEEYCPDLEIFQDNQKSLLEIL